MNNAVVIIPTYNEREGIVEAILSVKAKEPNAEIIVVDDNSPDGTAALVRSRFRKDKRVYVVVRKEKGGRGSAVIAGYKEGLKNKSAKFFIEMDADLCHDPKYIKQLVNTCKNADVVIASRYLPASRVTGWKVKRKVMSLAINTFAKIMLGIPISDYTNGYRCYSRKAVEFLCSQRLKSRGYVVLSEAAYRCYKKGMVFDEIAIDFLNVSFTKSNLNLQEIKEALFTILQLRFSK